jgi:hypothetical protein
MVGDRDIMFRIKEHNKNNKIKNIIGTFSCKNGFHIEKKFKNFLNNYNYKIIKGNEYFTIEEDIHKVFQKFKETLINSQLLY